MVCYVHDAFAICLCIRCSHVMAHMQREPSEYWCQFSVIYSDFFSANWHLHNLQPTIWLAGPSTSLYLERQRLCRAGIEVLACFPDAGVAKRLIHVDRRSSLPIFAYWHVSGWYTMISLSSLIDMFPDKINLVDPIMQKMHCFIRWLPPVV